MNLTETRATWARRSVALKMLAIAALIIVLLIPTLMLEGLIRERQMLRDQVQMEIASMWGGEQTVGGPVLTVPYVEPVRNGSGSISEITRYAHFLPTVLEIDGEVSPEIRRRGIYRAVLYNARLNVRGSFSAPNLAALGLRTEQMRWDDAFISLGVPDMRGVKERIAMQWNGRTLPANSGIPTNEVFASGVTMPVDLTALDSSYTFSVPLNLNGSGALGFLPFGEETRVTLRSPWPNPSFTGAFAADSRTVADSGFTAAWRVLHLNRNYGQQFIGAFSGDTRMASRGMMEQTYDVAPAGPRDPSAFGVRLMLPVDEYQKVTRASKYAMLFVFLTFLTFFFVEILGGQRIHPVQYLLVGFAICLFYLLLLSFTEHIPFTLAYWGTTAVIIGMILLYSKAIFKSWRLAASVAGLLLIFDLYFFVLLQLEEYALLAGSIGLLVTLAAVMYLSRRVDWYGVGEAPGTTPTIPPVVRAN